MLSEIEEGGDKIRFTYDENGILTSISVERDFPLWTSYSNTTSVEIGIWSELLCESYENKQTQYAYNKNGQVVQMTESSDYSNIVTNFSYDQAGRLVKSEYIYPDYISYANYIRDASGALVRVEDYYQNELKSTTEVKRDSQGRISESIKHSLDTNDPDTRYYMYSEDGTVIQKRNYTQYGNLESKQYEIRFDDVGNLIGIFGESIGFEGEPRIYVQYDYIEVDVPVDSHADALSNYLLEKGLLRYGFYPACYQ